MILVLANGQCNRIPVEVSMTQVIAYNKDRLNFLYKDGQGGDLILLDVDEQRASIFENCTFGAPYESWVQGRFICEFSYDALTRLEGEACWPIDLVSRT